MSNSASTSANTDQALRSLYQAFNNLDINAVLAASSDDVAWLNAREGGRVRGRKAGVWL